MIHIRNARPERLPGRTRHRPAASLIAVGTLLLVVCSSPPAMGDCTGQLCQISTHTASGDWDIQNGDCKTGNFEGSQPGTWNLHSCGDGSTYGWKDWNRTLTSVTHDESCVNTNQMGVSCIPCGFAPFQTGDCPVAPTTYAEKHRHRKEGPTGSVLYDHTWVSATVIVCACGKHACDE